MATTVRYVIIGGGLAGGGAVDGIRERDPNGPIVVIGAETYLPYDRPPLTKKLWFGKKKVDEIFSHDQKFYDEHGVKTVLGARAVSIDTKTRSVADDAGRTYQYDRLLLATGGEPRRLDIPGGELDGVCYFRRLDDYFAVREQARAGASAVVIGGGFIGSEIAAALAINHVRVTMVFPGPYLCHRVFPASLGTAIQQQFKDRGVEVLSGQKPVALSRHGRHFVTRVGDRRDLTSDILIVGVGIAPDTALAEAAGLRTGDGIDVNEFLQTSQSDIYAAGDVAHFSYPALARKTRVEHWDNAVTQGKWAGRNLAGPREPYTHMPYFFSDLFEFGYEAVGDVRADLEIVTDWKKENDTGVVYYLEGGRVRGAMMCNVWDRVPAARDLIRAGEKVTAQSLKGAIQ